MPFMDHFHVCTLPLHSCGCRIAGDNASCMQRAHCTSRRTGLLLCQLSSYDMLGMQTRNQRLADGAVDLRNQLQQREEVCAGLRGRVATLEAQVSPIKLEAL